MSDPIRIRLDAEVRMTLEAEAKARGKQRGDRGKAPQKRRPAAIGS